MVAGSRALPVPLDTKDVPSAGRFGFAVVPFLVMQNLSKDARVQRTELEGKLVDAIERDLPAIIYIYIYVRIGLGSEKGRERLLSRLEYGA